MQFPHRRVRTRSWRAVLAAVVIGAVLGLGTSIALGAYWHQQYLWKHGLDVHNGYYGHPFLTSADGACRKSTVAFVYRRTGYHSPYQVKIACHNHIYAPYYWDDTIAHTQSNHTGMPHHRHP